MMGATTLAKAPPRTKPILNGNTKSIPPITMGIRTIPRLSHAALVVIAAAKRKTAIAGRRRGPCTAGETVGRSYVSPQNLKRWRIRRRRTTSRRMAPAPAIGGFIVGRNHFARLRRLPGFITERSGERASCRFVVETTEPRSDHERRRPDTRQDHRPDQVRRRQDAKSRTEQSGAAKRMTRASVRFRTVIPPRRRPENSSA